MGKFHDLVSVHVERNADGTGGRIFKHSYIIETEI